MRARSFLGLWALVAAGCAGEAAGDYAAPYADAGAGGATSDAGSFGCLSSSECPTGWVCNEFNRCEMPAAPATDGGGVPPPEVEYKFSGPVSSERYVYVAMTAQDELARIDGATLAVRSTPVGEAPKVVGAIPGSDGAVVLDSTNGTAHVVRPSGETDTVRVLRTLPNLNRLDLDPSGRFAVAWFDLTKAIAEGDSIDDIGSFQDVTVIALGPAGGERAVDLTVGFRPREVEFDAGGNRAYVITQDGVSVIDLATATQGGPSIVPPIPVADPSVASDQLEVDIVATGQYAAVRQQGVAKLRIVGVGDGPERGVAREIPLASPATDIDLSPDGARLYAVEREAKKLAIVDVPGDAVEPSGVQVVDLANAAVGSFVLSRDGKRALMFTNATLDERITLIQLDRPGYPQTTWPLKKAVRAVGLSPTGTTAILIGAKAPGDPDDAGSVDEFIDRSYGYSLLDLASGFAKLQVTPVDPGPFSYARDGSKVYVALDGGDAVNAVRQLQIVTTQTGVVQTRALGSPPAAVGILPGANSAFVSQRHPLGRVSFVDLATDAMRTVTGFDLNGDIVE